MTVAINNRTSIEVLMIPTTPKTVNNRTSIEVLMIPTTPKTVNTRTSIEVLHSTIPGAPPPDVGGFMWGLKLG